MIELENLLERTAGDQDLLIDIIDIFIEDDCGARLDDIDAAIAAGDTEALRRAAHTFKGSAANFEAQPVTETALLLERTACEERLDDARAVAQELRRLADALCQELGALRARLAGEAVPVEGA